MNNLSMLVWLSQLGLNVALPPVGFVLVAVWLRNRFGWGNWVLWLGIVLGIILAIDGLRASLKAMEKMSEQKKKEKPPVSFNDHE